MSRRRTPTPSALTTTYDVLTLALERHEALALVFETHLRACCDRTGTSEELFAAVVLASVLHEDIQAIRVLGRAVWHAATAEERGGAS